MARISDVSAIAVATADPTRRYFSFGVKQGVFGKVQRRSLWGTAQDDGTVAWERASHDEVTSLVGSEVEEITIELVPIEKVTIVNVGRPDTEITEQSVVRFAGESLRAAVASYGNKLREVAEEGDKAPETFS